MRTVSRRTTSVQADRVERVRAFWGPLFTAAAPAQLCGECSAERATRETEVATILQGWALALASELEAVAVQIAWEAEVPHEEQSGRMLALGAERAALRAELAQLLSRVWS